MNMHTAIFLVNDKCRGMNVAFEACDENGAPVGDSRTGAATVELSLYKTLDQSLKKGDYVLGETFGRHHLVVYRIIEPDVEVDLEHKKYIPWIVGKVSQSPLTELRAREAELIEAIRRKDKDRKRAELAETMMKDYGEELKKLAITSEAKSLPAS